MSTYKIELEDSCALWYEKIAEVLNLSTQTLLASELTKRAMIITDYLDRQFSKGRDAGLPPKKE